MEMELHSWRIALYPLGFLASFLFTLRFFVQWIQSEKKKKSIVSKSFWRLSLLGNLAMAIHTLIQCQYPLFLIQSLSAVLAWRNLNLFDSSQKKSFSWVLFLLSLVLVLSTAFYALQSYYSFHTIDWIRVPKAPWSDPNTAIAFSPIWFIVGYLGTFIFALRFWTQWWHAEKAGKSTITPLFWWLSILGAVMALAFFVRSHDLVNILGYGIGLVPYLRNLVLLKKEKRSSLKNIDIAILVGEHSGDLHGKALIEKLRALNPDLSIGAVCGPRMRTAHVDVEIFPMEKLQVMGFTQVIKASVRLIFAFRKISQRLLQLNPQAIVFIDYPGLHMKLASSLRKKGFKGKLIHYVSPTVWAWKKDRIKSLEKTLDKLLIIYPFEKKCYENSSLEVEYVGSPLVEIIKDHSHQKLSFPQGKRLLSLFPGSRLSVILHNLSHQLRLAKEVLHADLDAVLALSIVESSHLPQIKALVSKVGLDLDRVHFVPFTSSYDLMKISDVAIATSGTVTLELALHRVPTLVVYAVSSLNAFFAKKVFKISLPYYCIVNILAGKEVFPEFVATKLDHKKMKKKLLNLWQETETRKKSLNGCEEVKKILGSQSASSNAAKAILNTLEKK